MDGAIPLDDDSASVVRDTLSILTSKEIKLSSLRRSAALSLSFLPPFSISFRSSISPLFLLLLFLLLFLLFLLFFLFSLLLLPFFSSTSTPFSSSSSSSFFSSPFSFSPSSHPLSLHSLPFLSSLSSFRNVSEELAEEGDQVGAAVATAQTKIISQVNLVYT